MLTAPNLISLGRVALTPVFFVLIADPDTTLPGIVLFALVAASDWVDGYLARRLGQVSDLGRLLDPTADRLAIGAGLIALAVRGAFPWWAAWPILARDAVLVVAGALLLLGRGIRVEVRGIGKFATFNLMVAVTCVSWGALGYPLDRVATVLGWGAYAIGVASAYAAAAWYAGDLRRAVRATRPSAQRAGSC